ncbi:hypothetical protein [Sinorhizobium fredii]|uniref:hypothetical protein n=1 Tax=Rhizobium fredii TaxID=380 RepID=UPI00142E721A|nr:hypothetical protein [Sinorhizobium fredii]
MTRRLRENEPDEAQMQRSDREKDHYDYDMFVIWALTVSALLIVGATLLMLLI